MAHVADTRRPGERAIFAPQAVGATLLISSGCIETKESIHHRSNLDAQEEAA